ncbi:(Fe-S)-binding protein [Candidatus Altiarchaeota archaeon]
MNPESKTLIRILEKLPLIDCGKCGEVKCRDFARRLLSKELQVFDCPHLDEEKTEEILLILDEFFK